MDVINVLFFWIISHTHQKFLTCTHLIMKYDCKIEISFHDATPRQKVILLSYVLQFLISFSIRNFQDIKLLSAIISNQFY